MSNTDCYKCKFKSNIPGNCHISCTKTNPQTSMLFTMLSFADIPAFQEALTKHYGFHVDQQPIQQGWFQFPLNYSSNWIQGNCLHFEKIDIQEIN